MHFVGKFNFCFVFTGNVAVLGFGLQTGWLSPLQPSLQTEGKSPLGENVPPLSDEEISWIGSLPSATLITCSPLFGYMMDRFGRRYTLLLTTAPNIVTYILLLTANNVNMVYISRLIGGFCSSGAFIVGPIYISEIASPNWKGALGGLTGFFAKLGIIISFVLGSYTSYLTMNVVSLSIFVLFLIVFPWIPESPVYLIKSGKLEQAVRALEKLYGSKNEPRIREEIKLIQNELRYTGERTKFEILKDFLLKREMRMGLLIVGSAYGFQMLSGYPAIVRYTVDIFERAGTTYSPHVAALFLAVSQLLLSFVGAFMLDRVGRKRFLVCGLALMGSSLAVVSLYLHLKSDYPEHPVIHSLRFLPSIALVCFIGFYASAFGTVPFVIIPEIFSPEARAMASSLLNLWFALVEFIVVKLFPTFTNLIQLSGSLAIFAGFGLFGSVCLQFIMFETKGKNFEEIQRKLAGKNFVANNNRNMNHVTDVDQTLL